MVAGKVIVINDHLGSPKGEARNNKPQFADSLSIYDYTEFFPKSKQYVFGKIRENSPCAAVKSAESRYF
jgi:hypothetical protein